MRDHLQEEDGMRGRKNLSLNSSCVSTSNREKLRCYCTCYRPVLGTSGADVATKRSWVPMVRLGREIKVSSMTLRVSISLNLVPLTPQPII